ncbi:MAG: hypothetical protein Q4C60_06775 [Eubacteriales bacterium]|nr:hypothetical protein [Eubacteriales bacterium]
MKNGKRAAIVGASAEAIHTIEAARALGVRVTALDGNPQAAGLAAADEARVIDISDETAALECLRQIRKEEGLDFLLVAPIGRYLTTTGAVNDALELRGISKEAAERCTDKWEFHRTLAEAGLRECRCELLDHAFWKRYGAGVMGERETAFSYPVVLKPRYGSGSRGIRIAESAEALRAELETLRQESAGVSESGISGGTDALPPGGKNSLPESRAAESGYPEDYVAEELVSGEEYGADGAVTADGFHLILLRKKRLTPLPARQAVGYVSVVPQGQKEAGEREDLTGAVALYLERIVRVLGLRDCLLHADLMIARGRAPFVIELSARPSGHFLHDLFTPLATGVDMAAEMVKYQMGAPYCFVPERVEPMMIRYFDFTGRAAYVPDEEEVKEVLDCAAETAGQVGVLPESARDVRAEEPVSGNGRAPEIAAGSSGEADDTVHLVRYECHIRQGDRLAAPDTGHVLMERGFFILRAQDDKYASSAEAEEALERAAERVLGAFRIV